MAASVRDHYGSADIVDRILRAIPWSPDDGTPLTPQQVFPFDQFHGRELIATQDHAARLNPPPDAHLLDMGCGIGGPARYFASIFGCKVTGIDLTPQFVAAATELSRLCGLEDRVDFVEADARSLSYGIDTFDHAYCLFVGMNLADKPAVLAECARVLRPGGRLLWTEVVSLDGPPHYPLPWSTTAQDSHVQSRERLVAALTGAGFEIVTIEDETQAQLDLARKAQQSGQTLSTGHHQANEVVLGPDFVERRKNYLRSLAEGLIANILLVARKPA